MIIKIEITQKEYDEFCEEYLRTTPEGRGSVSDLDIYIKESVNLRTDLVSDGEVVIAEV